jgi:hypothetical protein
MAPGCLSSETLSPQPCIDAEDSLFNRWRVGTNAPTRNRLDPDRTDVRPPQYLGPESNIYLVHLRRPRITPDPFPSLKCLPDPGIPELPV